MNDKAQTLAQRREMLIERCAVQRRQLVAQRLAMRQSFGIAQNVSRVAALARRSPLPLAGIALILAVMRPRRILALAVSAATAWKTWQRISPMAASIVRRLLK